MHGCMRCFSPLTVMDRTGCRAKAASAVTSFSPHTHSQPIYSCSHAHFVSGFGGDILTPFSILAWESLLCLEDVPQKPLVICMLVRSLSDQLSCVPEDKVLLWWNPIEDNCRKAKADKQIYFPYWLKVHTLVCVLLNLCAFSVTFGLRVRIEQPDGAGCSWRRGHRSGYSCFSHLQRLFRTQSAV